MRLVLIDNDTNFIWAHSWEAEDFDPAAYPDLSMGSIARAAMDIIRFYDEQDGVTRTLVFEPDDPGDEWDSEPIEGFRVHLAPPGWDYDPNDFGDPILNTSLVKGCCRFVGFLRQVAIDPPELSAKVTPRPEDRDRLAREWKKRVKGEG